VTLLGLTEWLRISLQRYRARLLPYCWIKNITTSRDRHLRLQHIRIIGFLIIVLLRGTDHLLGNLFCFTLKFLFGFLRTVTHPWSLCKIGLLNSATWRPLVRIVTSKSILTTCILLKYRRFRHRCSSVYDLGSLISVSISNCTSIVADGIIRIHLFHSLWLTGRWHWVIW